MTMEYISAIAVDFGSTNSGCAQIFSFDANGKLMYDTPHLIHRTETYAKDNTWFYIEPSFLERVKSNYNDLTDADFRIASQELHSENPNIIWGRKTILSFAEKIMSEKWVSFKNFKMLLRDGIGDAMLDFPLLTIIKTFMRVLKIECLHIQSQRMQRAVSADEILWGITIPAIWDDNNKHIMVDVAHSVFSRNARVLSEAEGPIVANLLMSSNNGKAEFQNGRTSLVIDLGGGTTDMCLMKEVQRQNGEYKLEMIADTDGSAAGGNDVDKAFYIYLLRHISSNKTSDAGVAYDTMDDEQLLRELFEEFSLHIGNFIKFENKWMELKSQRDLGVKPTCDFTFIKEYRIWLCNNGHSQLGDVVKDMLIDGCELPTDTFVEKVLNPTFKKICDKIAEIISSNKGKVTFDNIILAGGMSQNYALNALIKNTIKAQLGEQGVAAIREAPGLFAGASVMTGNCYLLINRGFIERIARRSYYYDCDLDSLCSQLRDEYAVIGTTLKLGYINELIDNEMKEGYKLEGRRGYIALCPIVLKDQIVKPFNANLKTDVDQTKLSIAFYSTDGEIVVFANTRNPLVKEEGEIKLECKAEQGYDLEVDFNEAQISNALHYLLKERGSSEVIAEGYIDVMISEQ